MPVFNCLDPNSDPEGLRKRSVPESEERCLDNILKIYFKNYFKIYFSVAEPKFFIFGSSSTRHQLLPYIAI